MFKNLFKKGQKRKDLIAEIKREFPKEGEQDPLRNEIKLLHQGLDEENNLWVRDFLLRESEFNVVELTSIDEKGGKVYEEATKAKARALALYDRWIDL